MERCGEGSAAPAKAMTARPRRGHGGGVYMCQRTQGAGLGTVELRWSGPEHGETRRQRGADGEEFPDAIDDDDGSAMPKVTI
jgi:hypothetical protein